MSAYLSRASLRDDAGLDALGPVLLPKDEDRRIGVSHRLVWTLFPGDRAAPRDFLWREDRPGHFLLLSQRPPKPKLKDLWSVETRAFAPEVAAGERLLFTLRVNAAVSHNRNQTGDSPTARAKVRRDDVVMHALHRDAAGGARSAPRAVLRARTLGWTEGDDGRPMKPTAPRDWLAIQGASHGFTVDDLAVLAYAKRRIPRDETGRTIAGDVRFSVLDLEGALTVDDPDMFLTKVHAGFGRSRAFGCGLMLLKRAPVEL